MAENVRVLARWDGWCSRCAHEARPLVLTMAGVFGPTAWWQGIAWEDRVLSLTCMLCGDVQHVPWDEADDPEVVLTEDTVEMAAPVETGAPVAASGAVVVPRPAQAVPAPRAPIVVDLVRRMTSSAPSPAATDSPDDVLDLLHLDLSRT